ncbi:hypothetical protein EDC04DRAFT_3006432 [Pisolithus marmoratus]|nr:hypothetical protein EDC04DRAFT_3006432 [Pisolithus marmoratus]
MGKRSNATAKTPTPLSSQSAWAKGPPPSNPSPQSPAPSNEYPTPSGSRRPAALDQDVSAKEGTSVPPNIVGAVNQGPSMGDTSAPVSSSPTATQVIGHESVKTFGTLPATRSSIIDGQTPSSDSGPTAGSWKPSSRLTPKAPLISLLTSPAPSSSLVSTSWTVPASTYTTSSTPSGTLSASAPSTSTPRTFNVAKLFHGNPSASRLPSDTTSPLLRPDQQPSAGQHAQQPPIHAPPLSGHLYTPYGPEIRPFQDAGRPTSRQIRTPSKALLARDLLPPTHPHPPSSAGIPPQQHPKQSAHWPGYYYMDYGSQWYHPMQAAYNMGHTPHSPGSAPQGPPHPSTPLSPRTQSPTLPPGPPTLTHAISHSLHTPQLPTARAHHPPVSISILPPPSTPSSLNSSDGSQKVIIRSEDGSEVTLGSFGKSAPQPSTTPIPPPSPRISVNGKSRLRLEQEKLEAEEREKKEEEEKVEKTLREEERARKAKEKKQRQEEERKRREEEERFAEERRIEELQERERGEREQREREPVEQEERTRAEREARRRRLEEADAETLKASDIVKYPIQELLEVEEDEEAFNLQVNSASNLARSQKESLRIDHSEFARRGSGFFDINAVMRNSSVPPLSALLTARNIDRLDEIEYPEGIRSPKAELNENAKDGKFRYDRDFLLQFMAVCKEKPPHLPPLDILGIEPVEQTSFGMSRGGSGWHRPPSGPMSTSGAHSASMGLGLGPFKPGPPPGPFAMGQFGAPGSKLTSEERFLMSQGVRSAAIGGDPVALLARPALTQTACQGRPGGQPAGDHSTRSKRGEKRTDPSKVGPAKQGPGYSLDAADVDTPEIVERTVKPLLNELTVEKFDSISDQIIAWATKSESERDAHMLLQVIGLVVEKATDEANRSEIYARLCRRMMETISPKVQDDDIKNAEGKPITGGQLFRKYLLNRCQEDFEHWWTAKEDAALAAAAKASDYEVIKAANEKKGDKSELHSDEYYAPQKANRQGIGLIKFIGELFKLQMLTERIMHECVKKLLGNMENHEEEEIESLCELFRTVGQLLDVPKAHAHMDVYFQRMRELCESTNVSPRMQFMLQDVIELRDRKWQPHNVVNAHTTLAAVHDAAAKEQAVQEAQAFQWQFSMSRGGERNAEPVPDGWAVAGGSQPRLPSKAGDLSHFGKISKIAPIVIGPSNVFPGKMDSKRESITHTNLSSNMFTMLTEQSRKPKLQLLPRPFCASGETPPPTSEEDPSAAPAAQISEEDTKVIDEDVKEYFFARSLEEI